MNMMKSGTVSAPDERRRIKEAEKETLRTEMLVAVVVVVATTTVVTRRPLARFRGE